MRGLDSLAFGLSGDVGNCVCSGADPMSAGGASGGQGVSSAPPAPLPSHSVPPPPPPNAANPLVAAAREQERVYMELLSRPPYNSDPILAQQVACSL